jgi:hypothetical protein
MVDEDHIGERGVVIRQCRLRDALYTVEIRPEPGNMNIRGQCGGETYTFVAIRREKKPILGQTLDGPCLRTQPITTKIIVFGGGARPQVTAVPQRDFYASSLAAPSP